MFQLVGQKQIADTETHFTFLSVFFLVHFSPSAIARRAILAILAFMRKSKLEVHHETINNGECQQSNIVIILPSPVAETGRGAGRISINIIIVALRWTADRARHWDGQNSRMFTNSIKPMSSSRQQPNGPLDLNKIFLSIFPRT